MKMPTMNITWFSKVLNRFCFVACMMGIYVQSAGYNRVCYFTNWTYRDRFGAEFTPKEVNTRLCTHIIYAFAKLENDKIVTAEPNDLVMYRQLNSLRFPNSNMKIILAVGGWAAGGAGWSKMAASSESRDTFVKSAVKFLRDHNFDGLDVDWVHPAKTNKGGKPEDKENFIKLLKDIRTEFKSERFIFGKGKLIVIADVSILKGVIDNGYDIPQIARYVSFVNLKTYDFHGSSDGIVGFNSPLYPRNDEKDPQNTLNIQWAVNHWIEKGMPRNRINIGMGAYGRTFKLSDTTNINPGAKTWNPGAAGQYTSTPGLLAYFEICKLEEQGGQTFWNEEQQCPFYVNGDLWVGFENERSIKAKAEYIKNETLGGGMIVSLDYDDFFETHCLQPPCDTKSREGFPQVSRCVSSETRYPIHNALNTVLLGLDLTTPPPTSRTSVTVKTSTKSPVTESSSATSVKLSLITLFSTMVMICKGLIVS